MLESVWISRTKQMWKLHVFVLLMLIDLGMLVVLTAQYNERFQSLESYLDTGSLAVIFMCVGIVVLLWVGLVFKCPDCKVNVGKSVMMETGAAAWFTSLLTLPSCPKCGSRADINKKK